MKKVLLSIFILLLFARCVNDSIKVKDCSIPATVKDFGGLDGCGFLFELNDGTILEPERKYGWCGTPPTPLNLTSEDPLFNFQYANGKKVLISYEPVEGVSACMVGKLVKITCIQAIDTIPSCLVSKIEEIKNDSTWNPPASVYRYSYHGKKVYFIPQHCCDIPSVLLDENCNVLCSPDGGISGGGDGKCPDFFTTRTNEEIIWQDKQN